jgi:hypothetical protein
MAASSHADLTFAASIVAGGRNAMLIVARAVGWGVASAVADGAVGMPLVGTPPDGAAPVPAHAATATDTERIRARPTSGCLAPSS